MRIAFSLPVALCLLALVGTGSNAFAQDQRPSFSLPQIITPERGESLGVDFDKAFNSIENPYLSDTIKLNYQISLLEKMVDRQTELQKISDSYQAMGASFNEPPPPKGICAQLPPNAPCLKYHPELYDNLVDARRAYYEELEAKAREAELARNPEAAAVIAAKEDPEVRARLEREAAERKAKAEAREREQRYRWTEVTCSAGNCRGVLVKPAAGSYRATVHEGTRLPDGTLVQRISANGIRVSISGQVIDVRPAPGEAGSTEAGLGGNPIANALEQAGLGTGSGGGADGQAGFDETRAATAAVLANAGAEPTTRNSIGFDSPFADSGAGGTVGAAAATDNSGAAGQTMAEPPLGPSGLF